MNSSGNNSLSSNGVDLPSHYALRVALQTMKERCVALQQRLSIIEDENSMLRNQTPIKLDNLQNNSNDLNILRGCQSDIDNLRKQIEELTIQKSQLNEHITMIATENRQLWSRLSQLAKDKGYKHNLQQLDGIENSEDNKKVDQQQQQETNDHMPKTAGSGQNLIRSRTFTQHSPNPLLRQKHLAAIATNKTITNDKSLDDINLEEISLKDIPDGINKVSDDGISRNNNNSLGFGYLNDDSSDGYNGNGDVSNNGADVEVETKKCVENMIEIKNEILKQQNDLTEIINVLKDKKAKIKECPDCKQQKNNKPKLVDKMIETDDDLISTLSISGGGSFSSSIIIPTSQQFNYQQQQQQQKQFNDKSKVHGNSIINLPQQSSSNYYNQNDLEAKRRADKLNKICPMCGEIFSEEIKFDDFEQHVESHFIDDNELDQLQIEKNYEFVSHTVGNF